MLKLLVGLVLLLLLGQVAGFWVAQRQATQHFNAAALSRHWQARAMRWEARADTLYREARAADVASAWYAERMVRAQGALDQCRAYQF